MFCSECGTKQAPVEKKCTNCGAVLVEGAKFCMNCGTPVAAAAASPSPETPKAPKESQMQKKEAADFEVSRPDENTLSYNIKGIPFNMKLIKGGMVGNTEVSDFYIGETVVTQALWQTVMGDNPSKDNSDLQYPVTNITKQLANTFLIRLKKITGEEFALPTSSQFKYVALKGCEQLGEDDFKETTWGDSNTKMHPVCSMMPTPLGLYDLSEWRQLVIGQLPDGDLYRFNPPDECEDGVAGRLKSFEEVNFIESRPQYTTLRIVMNIPVSDEVEKVKRQQEDSARHQYEEGLLRFRICRNNKYGFMDRNGREVIPCKYDDAEDFSEGLVRVQKGGKYGFIDQTGKEVVPYKYDKANDFSEGLARVEKNKKYGFIDRTGKEVIACKYDEAEDFHDGLACVGMAREWKWGIPLNVEWAFIDKTGKKVLSCKYDYVWGFSEGLARVEKDKKIGFIDKTGAVVIPCKYDKAGRFSDGLALVKKDRKFGFIDNAGKEVVPCKYSDAEDFSEGLARVNNGGKYGLIDQTGKEVVPCKYDDAMDFHEGLACVAKDGKFGYLDKAGKVVIPCRYDYDEDDDVEDYAGDFHNGLALIELEDETFYIDKKGNTVYAFED